MMQFLIKLTEGLINCTSIMLCSLKQNSSLLLQLTCVVTDKQQMVLFSVIKNQLTKQAISFWAKYTKLPRTTVWKIFLISELTPLTPILKLHPGDLQNHKIDDMQMLPFDPWCVCWPLVEQSPRKNFYVFSIGFSRFYS